MARARVKPTGQRKGGKPPFRCRKCGNAIEPGQDRYEWSFRYGGTYRQHVSCGAPRASELTQSAGKQTLYAAQEAVEDALGGADPETIEEFESWRDGIASALRDASSDATDVAGDYEAAAEPFGGEGENAERRDSCETWASDLDDAASEVEDVEVEAVEREADESDEDFEQRQHEALDTAVQDVRSKADDAIWSLEL